VLERPVGGALEAGRTGSQWATGIRVPPVPWRSSAVRLGLDGLARIDVDRKNPSRDLGTTKARLERRTTLAKFRLRSEPVWPTKCAACGAAPAAMARATCSVVQAALPIGVITAWSTLRTEIEYPVCQRHRWTSMIAGRFSRRSLFNLGIGVMTVFSCFAVITHVVRRARGLQATMDPGTVSLFLGIACTGIVMFFVGRRFTPVRLLDVSEQTITLWFQNEEYAQEFREANSLWIEVL
jgi:hypothetical protein